MLTNKKIDLIGEFSRSCYDHIYNWHIDQFELSKVSKA